MSGDKKQTNERAHGVHDVDETAWEILCAHDDEDDTLAHRLWKQDHARRRSGMPRYLADGLDENQSGNVY